MEAGIVLYLTRFTGDVPSTGLSPGKELQTETAGHLQNTRRDITELRTPRQPSASSPVIKPHIELPINLHLITCFSSHKKEQLYSHKLGPKRNKMIQAEKYPI